MQGIRQESAECHIFDAIDREKKIQVILF